MKHLEQNEKFCNVRSHVNLGAYDIDKCFRQWKERAQVQDFLEDLEGDCA